MKKLSTSLRGITSTSNDDFYCLNCLHSIGTCENKDFLYANMPSDNTKILEFNQYQKYDIEPLFIIYADLECIIKKVHGCKNNPKNSSATKVSERIPSGFSISTISSL